MVLVDGITCFLEKSYRRVAVPPLGSKDHDALWDT